MEGLSAVKEIMSFVNEFGFIPVMLVICIIFYFLNKDNKKSFEKINQSISSLKESIENVKKKSDDADKHIRVAFEKQFDKITEQLTLLGREIDYIGSAYIPKEQHYKDIEGWKAEINYLRKETSRMPYELMRLLMQQRGEKNETESSAG